MKNKSCKSTTYWISYGATYKQVHVKIEGKWWRKRHEWKYLSNVVTIKCHKLLKKEFSGKNFHNFTDKISNILQLVIAFREVTSPVSRRDAGGKCRKMFLEQFHNMRGEIRHSLD